jgi:hypothetical protein
MKSFYSLLIIVAIGLVSCKKDQSEQYIHSSKDHSLALQSTIDLYSTVQNIGVDYLEDGVYDADTTLSIISSPAFESTTYPKTITIDFGEQGREGADNKIRKGEIILTIESSAGLDNIYTVLLDSFYVDNTNLVGTYTSSSSANVESLSFTNGLRFINANGTTQLSGSLNIENVSTNEKALSFSMTGQDTQGTSFSAIQGVAPTVFLNCSYYLVGGTALVTPNGRDQQTVNYGSNSCDANVSVVYADGSAQGFSLR